MPHTIVTNICEGVADCVGACPVACIHPGPGKNVKGTDWFWIDFDTCIDCGICLQVCPVERAIVPDERRVAANSLLIELITFICKVRHAHPTFFLNHRGRRGHREEE